MIASLYNVLGCKSLDEVLEQLEFYEKQKEEILIKEYEINTINKDIENINEQLADKDDEIRKKLMYLD